MDNSLGDELHARIRRLYPICRSITGDGVRETLRLLGEEIDLQIREVATGTPVFDWSIPLEWNIRDAYIKNRDGERVVDFGASNLHVVNYSTPVRARMSLAELRPHLFTLPEFPDRIPYKTSYYKAAWGFCLTERQLQSLTDGEYDVCIDASLAPGHLTFGECVLPGREDGEVLISAHVCHPALCNDNLSGISVAVTLARQLARRPHRYTYRFVFAPGTIGAITWLALNEQSTHRIRHGLVLACVGDRGNLHYKKSRRGTADIDRAAAHVLALRACPGGVEPFSPSGYDERQYCSPGFDLPVGVLSRTPHGRFSEYHTSADNLEFVDGASLADTVSACFAIFAALEENGTFVNQHPKCEPQLGKRGLYSSMGGHVGDDRRLREEALLWVLNLSDGLHSLLDIAEQAGLPFAVVRRAATDLLDCQLLGDPSATR